MGRDGQRWDRKRRDVKRQARDGIRWHRLGRDGTREVPHLRRGVGQAMAHLAHMLEVRRAASREWASVGILVTAVGVMRHLGSFDTGAWSHNLGREVW